MSKSSNKEKIYYRYFLFASAAVIIFFIGISIFGSEGLIKLKSLYSFKSKLEIDNYRLFEANQKLKQQIQLLNEPQYIQRMIREQLGYIHPNEKVIIVDEK